MLVAHEFNLLRNFDVVDLVRPTFVAWDSYRYEGTRRATPAALDNPNDLAKIAATVTRMYPSLWISTV